jgi:hypothetical protein
MNRSGTAKRGALEMAFANRHFFDQPDDFAVNPPSLRVGFDRRKPRDKLPKCRDIGADPRFKRFSICGIVQSQLAQSVDSHFPGLPSRHQVDDVLDNPCFFQNKSLKRMMIAKDLPSQSFFLFAAEQWVTGCKLHVKPKFIR